MLRLLFAILFVTQGALADETTKVWCDYGFSDEILEIDNKVHPNVNACVTDTVWGFDNVCYEGTAQGLVDRINNDEFVWKRAGLIMDKASVNEDDDTIVNYTGVDQMSFFSGKKDLAPCSEEFLKQIK